MFKNGFLEATNVYMNIAYEWNILKRKVLAMLILDLMYEICKYSKIYFRRNPEGRNACDPEKIYVFRANVSVKLSSGLDLTW